MQSIGERIIFDIQIWKIILVAVLIFFSFYIYRRTYPSLSFIRRIVLGLTRACAFFLLILFILNPAVISVKSESREPLVLVLFDVSKSMSVRDCNGRSRFESALAGLHVFEDALQKDSETNVEVIPFSSELMTAVAMDSVLEATGEGTDILRAIHEAQGRYRSENVAAIVLLSDGRVTRGVVSSGVPVSEPLFAIQFGDTLDSADISIEDVYYDRTVYMGTKEVINAVVKVVGFEGAELAVQLIEEGDVRDRVVLTVPESSVELDATFEFKPEKPGEHSLTIEAVPLNLEERRENNRETIRIRVLKDKIRLLYMDQYADWNLTFVRDLVMRSERFEIEAVTWLPGKGHFRLGDREPWDFPDRSHELSEFDLIIVSDDTKFLIDQSNVTVLEDYVEGGGGLLLLVDEHSPAIQRQSMVFLEQMLPVRLTGRARMLTGEFPVRIAEGMGRNQLAAVLAEDNFIDVLPPLLAQFSGIEVTAGAAVPLVMGNGDNNRPFFAFTRHGDGITAVVMGFPLWRWKLAADPGRGMYDAFFGGIIQYLAEGIDASPLELESDRTVYRAGDRISLTVHTQGSRHVDNIRGEVIQDGGEDESLLRTFLFEPDTGRESVLRAVLDPLPPGDYRIIARELQDSGAGSASEVEFSVLPISVEFLRTASDISFLRELAVESGGEALSSTELAAIPEMMNLQEDEVITREVRALREGPALFICILLFFAVEWILRKSWGLV